MLLIICVDRDDDIGRKTGAETPIIGREKVEEIAHEFGVTDPEDSDLNALFQAMQIYDEEEGEAEIVVLTGSSKHHRNPDRAIARQLEEVLTELDASSAIVVTDGAEDEGVIPIVESRLKIDGVRRTVVRQAQNLENAYHVLKQLLRDPETRGTILIPLGILLMLFPINIVMEYLNYPNAALGVTTALLGIYFLVKGLGLDDRVEDITEVAREGIYSGKVSLITYFIAAGLLVIGVASGFGSVQQLVENEEVVVVGLVPLAMAFLYGAVVWLTFGGVVSSIGRILDEYIQKDDFPRPYLNAPFYVVSMGVALYGVSGFFLGLLEEVYFAALIVVSIGVAVTSTAVFGGIGRGSQDTEEGAAQSDDLAEVD